MNALQLAWTGIFAIIYRIYREQTAYNGFHDFSLENDIILKEREFLIRSAIKFFNCEIEQSTFEAIVRYYFQIIAIESYKVWQDKVDGMVLQWYYDNVPEKVVEDRYVLQTLEQLPTKELEWMEQRLKDWTYVDSLPDILPVTMTEKFNNWKNWI